MFDISALLCLKPTGPVIDQGVAPGSEAAQINPFSEILSNQLGAQGAVSAEAEPVLPQLAALAATTDQAGKRQQSGKMLPGELPGALPIASETGSEEIETPEAAPINPLGAILASRVEAQTKPAGLKTVVADPRAAKRAIDAEAPVATNVDDAPEDETSVETAISVEVQPIVVAAVTVPAVQLSIPAAIQFTAAPTANRPAPMPAHAAANSPAIVAPAQIAGTAPTGLPAAALPAVALPAVALQVATDILATPVPQAATTIPAPAAAVIPATTLAAIVQAPAVQVEAELAAPAVPATSTIALVAAQALSAVPVPILTGKAPVAEAQAVAEAPTEGAPTSLLIDVPTERPAVAVKAKGQRAQPTPAAIARKEETAVPAQASAITAPATERSAPAAPTVQPTAILAEARQPVVGPAAVSIPTAAPAPQDFATIVDRLIAARETAAPQPVQASIAHVEFGRVSLNFQQNGGALTVAMTSADPGFAPAVLAAMAADKSASTDSQQQQQAQPQAQAPVAAQAQAQAQTQSQNQSPPQSQSQSQNQNQQAGNGSGQFNQDAGQRGTDGSGAQGRGGQDRSGRYQSNPSPAGRDNGSPELRSGTYA